jgi:O-antigen biosynthesis protein
MHARRISIVVPVFNRPVETRAMLESLRASLRHRQDWELVLVDDASAPATAGWLHSLACDGVEVVHHHSNQGFATSVNDGVARCRGELLVLANNDLVFSAGWLEPMLQILEDPFCSAGVVGNVQRRISDETLDHAGVDLNYRGQLDHIRELPGTWPPSAKSEAFAVTGACCALTRALFEDAGQFDVRYLNGCEDMDLCFKAMQRGRRNWVALSSNVGHHVGLTRQPGLQDERNSELLFTRWAHRLADRLGERLKDLYASGRCTEPVFGCDDLDLADARGIHAADWLRVAHGVLERNAAHRSSRLRNGRNPAGAPVDGIHTARAPAGTHSRRLAGRRQVSLPSPMGLRGVHLLANGGAGVAPGSGFVVVEINGFQRLRAPMKPGSIELGTQRPVIWKDATNQVEIYLEDASGRELPPTHMTYEDISVSGLVLDDELVSFEHLTAAGADHA